MTMRANLEKIEYCPDISDEDKLAAVYKLPYQAKALGLAPPRAVEEGMAVADAMQTLEDVRNLNPP